ncbi:MAG: hypothetical protein LBU43_12275 [Candidatus Accumulibacter sp.]|jgi:hypothetical protein|nr:hypothetical protein [Accumulibacter sp.]
MPTITSVTGSTDISGIYGTDEATLDDEATLNAAFAAAVAQLKLNDASETKFRAVDLLEYDAKQIKLLNTAREMLAQATQLGGSVSGDASAAETPELHTFITQHNIPFDATGKDQLHTSAQWDINIRNLETFIESLAAGIQTNLVNVEYQIGRYEALHSDIVDVMGGIVSGSN